MGRKWRMKNCAMLWPTLYNGIETHIKPLAGLKSKGLKG